MERYDVLIAGGGVIGCAIARELSRLEGRFALLEACEDVCSGTSKANSGIVHAGFDAKEGSLMAKMNVKGHAMMESLCQELDVPFEKNGSLVLCFDPLQKDQLELLYQRGKANGVRELYILDEKSLHELEPAVSPKACAALYAPEAGIVDPFLLTTSLADCAAQNGVSFFMNQKVLAVEPEEEGWKVSTPAAVFHTRWVINAAGVHGDDLHNQVSPEVLKTIVPRKGSYMLLDKTAGPKIHHTLFQLPTSMGKGVLVTPTTHGNILVGPTSLDQKSKDDTSVAAPELADIAARARLSVPDLELAKVITSFCGLRAHEQDHEFFIQESRPHFIDVIGIESPGLSSAPAIAEYVRKMVEARSKFPYKSDFQARVSGIPDFIHLDRQKQKELLEANPAFGQIVCRCEGISRAQIEMACQRPVPAVSLDGVKRRVRAGMGRCQSGFCLPRVMEILAEQRNIPLEEVSKNQTGSQWITGHNKEDL